MSDISEFSDATPVEDECRCLAPAELSSTCLATTASYSGTPGTPHDPFWNRGECVGTGGEAVECLDGSSDCGAGTCPNWRSPTQITYSEVCYDIAWGNRFKGGAYNQPHGQHSIYGAEWFWCFTAGACRGQRPSKKYTTGGCDNYWAYFDQASHV